MKKIGIMGGTFDPIHYGHIITASKVLCRYHLDEVVFVPSGNPPHKKNLRITPATDRLAMVEAAIDGHYGFSISTVEIERPGYSYALDTVNYFYEIYGDDIDLYFITGADAISEIATWYRADELMAKCRFIAAARPGYSFEKDDPTVKKYSDRIRIFAETALAISSSEIRCRVAAKEDISKLTPPSVAAYIKKHQLYL